MSASNKIFQAKKQYTTQNKKKEKKDKYVQDDRGKCVLFMQDKEI